MNTAALFDLDGVLVDTESQYTRFWKHVGETDFPQIPDFAIRIKGRALVEILDEYYPGDAAKQQQVRRDLAHFESTMQYEPVPGAWEFVASLRKHGIKTAVVTSSDRTKMQYLYAACPSLSALFDHIFTAEDATASKPAPDCYIHAAQCLGFAPGDCFVFEDSLNGLEAGRRSGATVVGLTTGHPAEVVAQYSRCTLKDFTAFTVEDMLNLKQ